MDAEFRQLRSEPLLKTAQGLATRIGGGFPQAGLAKVAATLVEVTEEVTEKAAEIQRPIWWLRIALGLLALLVVILAIVGVMGMQKTEDLTITRVLDFLRLTPVYLGAVVLFLITLETRYKRFKAIKAIHELRALAHIVDMHQLTKNTDCDPNEANKEYSREDIIRYLQYCTELLALMSKLGQLYVQDFPDGTTLAAVDQFENLTNGLSHKIWQKIIILQKLPDLRAPTSPADG